MSILKRDKTDDLWIAAIVNTLRDTYDAQQTEIIFKRILDRRKNNKSLAVDPYMQELLGELPPKGGDEK